MQMEDCRVPCANSLPKISAGCQILGFGLWLLALFIREVFFLLVVYEEIRNIKGASMTLLSYMPLEDYGFIHSVSVSVTGCDPDTQIDEHAREGLGRKASESVFQTAFCVLSTTTT